jgi:hypothetical protein
MSVRIKNTGLDGKPLEGERDNQHQAAPDRVRLLAGVTADHTVSAA